MLRKNLPSHNFNIKMIICSIPQLDYKNYNQVGGLLLSSLNDIHNSLLNKILNDKKVDKAMFSW